MLHKLFSPSKEDDLVSSQVHLRRNNGIIVNVMTSKLKSRLGSDLQNKKSSEVEGAVPHYTLMFKLESFERIPGKICTYFV